MNEQINWDQSLVKKYSTSNHFKLLNQLRNEVKKYPLNKKKNTSTTPTKDKKIEVNDNIIRSNPQNENISRDSSIRKELNVTKSTVSFNNSKNFSIYNNNNSIDMKKDTEENNPYTEKKLRPDYSSSTFNDRLDQIEMK